MGGVIYETYIYDGKEWLANSNIYTVDDNSIVLVQSRFELKGFAKATNNTVALKKNNKLQWVPLQDISPIQEILNEDKLLKLDNQVLSTSIKLVYKNATNEVLLIGKDNKTISSIDASNFIINNMLNSLSYNADTNVLTFVWNTAKGKQTNSVEISNIIEPYKSGTGIKIGIDQDIAILIDDKSEKFLSVGPKGIKLSGVSDCVETSKQNAITTSNSYTDQKIQNILETYITGSEGTLEKLQKIADWIEEDSTGTAQIIGNIDTNTKHISEHSEEITKLNKVITELKLEGNTTYHFEGLSEGRFKVTSSENDIIEIDTGAKTYTDNVVKILEDSINKQIKSLDNIYLTSEDVKLQIDNKINDLELHIIDGGNIADVNAGN